MRTLVRVTIPVEIGNAKLRDGSLTAFIGATLDKLKPEAAYFFPEGGHRHAMFVVDMKDSSELAKIAEPFWAELEADVEFTPVMNLDDLKKGLGG
jgi:hypothetical protein